MPLFFPAAGAAVHVDAESAPWLPWGCVPSGSFAEMYGVVFETLLIASRCDRTGASGAMMGESFHAGPEPPPVGVQNAAVPFEKYIVMKRRRAAAVCARAVRGANVSSQG